MNGNTIISMWKEIEREEQEMNERILKYIFMNMKDEIEYLAIKLYNDEIESNMDPNSILPWYEERNNIMSKMNTTLWEFEDKAISKLCDFDTNSKEFRQRLFWLITNRETLSDNDKAKAIDILKKQLLKLKNSDQYKRKDIAIGDLAHGTFRLLINNNVIDNKKYEINSVNGDYLIDALKSAFYQYSNSIQKGNNNIAQANITSVGFINELEDKLKENILLREDFVKDIASMMSKEFDAYATEVSKIDAHKKIQNSKNNVKIDNIQNNNNLNYDIKVQGIYGIGNNTVTDLNFYFDSKSNLAGVGSTESNYVITSQDVISYITMDSQYNNNLKNYNVKRNSYDNELLLEYLVKQYGKRPLYYLIEKSKQEVYPLSFLVKNNQLYMDPKGLELITDELNNGIYMIQYAKAIKK